MTSNEDVLALKKHRDEQFLIMIKVAKIFLCVNLCFFLLHNRSYISYLMHQEDYKLASAQLWMIPGNVRGDALLGSEWYIWSVEDGEDHHYQHSTVLRTILEQKNDWIPVYYNTLGKYPHVVRTTFVIDTALTILIGIDVLILLQLLYGVRRAQKTLEFHEACSKMKVVDKEDSEEIDQEISKDMNIDVEHK